MTIRKSSTVRITPATNTHLTELRAHRPITEEEEAEWNESDDSKGMNCAGETKLPPRSVGFLLTVGGTYTVLKARCRVALGWGSPQGGLVLIHDPVSGENLYVHRRNLTIV